MSYSATLSRFVALATVASTASYRKLHRAVKGHRRRLSVPPSTEELEMLHTPLPEQVRTALLLHQLIQDDLLAVQVLLDVVDDLPDGARYLPLGPGVADSGRSDDLSYKDRLELLLQNLECYVLDAYHQVDQRIAVLRKRYPNYDF